MFKQYKTFNKYDHKINRSCRLSKNLKIYHSTTPLKLLLLKSKFQLIKLIKFTHNTIKNIDNHQWYLIFRNSQNKTRTLNETMCKLLVLRNKFMLLRI